MFKPETCLELQNVLGFETMLQVVQMKTILSTTKPKKSDYGTTGAFGARCQKRFLKASACGVERAEWLFKVLLVVADYETRQSLEGLGGCVAYPLCSMLEKDGLIANKPAISAEMADN